MSLGNNVNTDGVIVRPCGERGDRIKMRLKFILEFKAPPSETARGGHNAEHLAEQIGQAFAYAKYACLDGRCIPRYDIGTTVRYCPLTINTLFT